MAGPLFPGASPRAVRDVHLCSLTISDSLKDVHTRDIVLDPGIFRTRRYSNGETVSGLEWMGRWVKERGFRWIEGAKIC